MQVLTFDNVRPASLSLDELFAGRVAVQLFGAVDDVPAVLLALPGAEQPSTA